MINASRRFRSGMRIVAMGTFFLVVKAIVAVSHIGEPVEVRCTPIVEESDSMMRPRDRRLTSEARKQPYRCEF